MVYNQMVVTTRLDGRYIGGKSFKWCVEFPYKRSAMFCSVREWCWETWGPSRELKFFTEDNKQVWAFITDNYRTRIYLKSDKELNWYKLRWE